MSQEPEKISEEDDNTIKGKETKNTVTLGLAFYAAFTAFHALQSLQSSLNESHNLGVISLSVIYGTFVVSGILAPTVIRFLGIKPTIILSFVVHLLYTTSNFYPAFYTLIPSSALLGGISGFLWTSQSTYVTVCATSKSKHSGKELYSTLSNLTGLFYAIFQTTQIPGNLISSLVLKIGTFSNVTVEEICGPKYCPSSTNSTDIALPDETVVHILLGTFLVFNVTAIVVTCVFLSPIKKSTWIVGTSLKESLSSFFVILFTTKIFFLVPMFLYQSLASSILKADYTRSYVSCPLGIHMVGFTMAIFGAATGVSSFIFSRVVRITGRYLLFFAAASLHAGIFTVLHVWTPKSTDIQFILLLPAAWGIADGIFYSQMIALTGLFFPERKEPAFANLYTWESVGSTVTFALGSVMCMQTKLIIVYVMLGTSMALYTGVEIYHRSTSGKKLECKEVNNFNLHDCSTQHTLNCLK